MQTTDTLPALELYRIGIDGVHHHLEKPGAGANVWA
jgi:hypothetical protein